VGEVVSLGGQVGRLAGWANGREHFFTSLYNSLGRKHHSYLLALLSGNMKNGNMNK
jgi:hypothetical protein